MRYRLRTLLIAVVFVGLICVLLRAPSAWGTWAIFSVTLLALLTSVLAIIYCRDAARAFAVGFLVFGGSFLALLLLFNSGRLWSNTTNIPLSHVPEQLYYRIYPGPFNPGHHYRFMEAANTATAFGLGVLGGLIAQALRSAQAMREISMVRYKLRTLLIALTVGPPILAWAWFYAVPIVTWLAILLIVLVAALFFRSLLWGIEGLLVVAAWMLAAVRQATRRKRQPSPGDAVEFSLSRYAAKVKARDQK